MENRSANCPHCNSSLMVPSVANARFTCPYCSQQVVIVGGQLLKEAPQASGMGNEALKARAARMKKILIYGGAALFIFILAYTFFLKEYWAYKAAIGSDYEWSSKSYLDNYPNGRYVSQVKEHYEDVIFNQAAEQMEMCDPESCSCDQFDDYSEEFGKTGRHSGEVDGKIADCYFRRASNSGSLADINFILTNFPNTPYKGRLNTMRDSVWTAVIEAFNEGNSSGKGHAFFGDLLSFCKDNGSPTVYVDFDHTLKLKDWMDFDEDTRDGMDLLVELYNIEAKSNPASELDHMDKPSDSPPPSLKRFFTTDNLEDLEADLCTSLEENFNKVFNNQLFRVLPESKGEGNNPPGPVIHIAYKIENEIEDGIPSLYQQYTYREGTYGLGSKTFNGHILGIMIGWEFNMSLPTGKSFAFVEKSSPATELKDVDDVSSAYKKMTSSAFTAFARNIAYNFGLHQVRLDGDGDVDFSVPEYDEND